MRTTLKIASPSVQSPKADFAGPGPLVWVLGKAALAHACIEDTLTALASHTATQPRPGLPARRVAAGRYRPFRGHAKGRQRAFFKSADLGLAIERGTLALPGLDVWMFAMWGCSTSRATACINTASRKVGPREPRPADTSALPYARKAMARIP